MPEQMQEHTSRDTGCAGAGGCLNTWWLPTRSPSKVHLPICLATNSSKKSSDAPSMTTAYPAETKGSWGAAAVVGGPGSHAAAVWAGGQPCPSSAAIRATAARGKVGTQLPPLPPSVGQRLLIGTCCAFMGTLCLCSARPLLKYKRALKQGQRTPCPPPAPNMHMVHIN